METWFDPESDRHRVGANCNRQGYVRRKGQQWKKIVLLDLLVFVLLFQALNCPPIYFLIEDRAGVSYYYYYY